jgi:hypothetical protein
MKTPITDYASDHSDAFESPAKAREFARCLERDRAALMESLVNLERRATFGIITKEYLNKSRRALAAARANFP